MPVELGFALDIGMPLRLVALEAPDPSSHVVPTGPGIVGIFRDRSREENFAFFDREIVRTGLLVRSPLWRPSLRRPSLMSWVWPVPHWDYGTHPR